MFTIVRSSRVMKNPSETTSSTAQGFPCSFLTASPCLHAAFLVQLPASSELCPGRSSPVCPVGLSNAASNVGGARPDLLVQPLVQLLVQPPAHRRAEPEPTGG